MAIYVTHGTVVLTDPKTIGQEKPSSVVLTPGTEINSSAYLDADIKELVRLGALLSPSAVLPASELDAAIAEREALRAEIAALRAAQAAQGLGGGSATDTAIATAEAEAGDPAPKKSK